MSGACPELRFVVRITPRGTADDAQLRRAFDDLRRQLADADLVAHASGTRELVVSREGSQATQADRQLVLSWAATQANVATIDVSDLLDLPESA